MSAIAQVGDAILMLKAKPVADFNDALVSLADRMLLELNSAKGVGLAAPQLNESLAMFIMASHPNERYPDAPWSEPTVVVNPEIIDVSGELDAGEEGCLSIAKQKYVIKRHTWVKVRYQDLKGIWHQQTLSEFIARIFQHEYDHLQGITLIERMKMQVQLTDEAK